MDFDAKKWQEWFANNRSAILEDYFTFLRFRSIGVDSSCKQECTDCAQWVESYLKDLGLSTQVWETPSHPIIFAEKRSKSKDAPTLLIYHHYDVQPVDPIELWDSDPFEPVLKGETVYARGAQDNKGQCMYSLAAIKALLSFEDELPFHLKVFLEGDEEAGSSASEPILYEKKEELASDAVLVVDVLLPAPGVPSVTSGVRGILGFEVVCRGAKEDLHSGEFGGVAYNPLRALSSALSSIWDQEGKIAIPHFYDDLVNLSEQQRSLLNFELEESFLKEMGVHSFCAEPGFSIGESRSIRPTVEIHGLSGGYSGGGIKTVIPKEAKAKLSCRLVPNQEPEKIFSLIGAHLEKQMPKGMEIEVICKEGKAGYWSSPDSLIAQVAKKAYEEVMGKKCSQSISGASIPILNALAKVAGGDVLLIGYGLPSDQIHAPNEHFGLDRFEMGFLTMGSIFSQFHESKR